jgi:hypothetical protein
MWRYGATSYWDRGRPRPRCGGTQRAETIRYRFPRFALVAGEGARGPSAELGYQTPAPAI